MRQKKNLRALQSTKTEAMLEKKNKHNMKKKIDYVDFLCCFWLHKQTQGNSIEYTNKKIFFHVQG